MRLTRLRNRKGFTLIELVMIIVILGILAASAVIKYVDLQSDAEDAAIQGIYGHLASAYGISIASLKRNPNGAEVNANIGGTPGTLRVNGSSTIIFINATAGSTDNTIFGTKRKGSFQVTLDGSDYITEISSLILEDL